MAQRKGKLGVYMSYNEGEWGAIDESVDISNSHGYLIWGNTSVIIPEQFDFPTLIVIRPKGRERYYEGILWAVKRPSKFSVEQFLAEENHRPPSWQARVREFYSTVQSVLYITGLKGVLAPPEVKSLRPPQRPTYFTFSRAI